MSLKEVASALYAAQVAREAPKASKYRNVKVELDGITFDSKHEAHRWAELRLSEKAGLIRKLERQRPFAIVINDLHVCDYRADFVYEEMQRFGDGESWQRVVEDAKGMRTDIYRLKKKLMKACLGIEILETRRQSRK